MMTVVTAMALLGAFLMGGVFFAFSSFVMKALSRVPAAEGVRAMQSINVVVLNRTFLGVFMGTAALSVWLVVWASSRWGESFVPYVLSAAGVYLVGVFLVTALGNVPLNNRLAEHDGQDAGAEAFWAEYLTRWTRLNTVRTIAGIVAGLLYTLGLLQL